MQTRENIFGKIADTLQSWILYQPLKDEIDPKKIPFLTNVFDQRRVYKISKNKHEDPFSCADSIAREVASSSCGILVPGSKFDAHGTRYGRGRGWFDRFLSAVPLSWTRIGVADNTRISKNILTRKPWDEPVDWIIIRVGSTWKVAQTRARSLTDGQTSDE
ncbi:hypothetical protein HYV71_03245 [Candidatus Uhrbacteria bacterium]|nr:hypothetical protein [Candidatus Uhrbacteria bacterium]